MSGRTPPRGKSLAESEKRIEGQLFGDLKEMIEESRSRTAAAVNAEITLLYWHVGTRINREILANARAEYGKEVVEGTSKFLTQIYGRGWSPQQLWQCIKLSTVLQKDILYSLSIELSWTHIRTIMYINDPVKRDLYFEMAKAERWSVAQLRGRINSLMFERTAISKKPESLIAQELSALSSGATISPDLAFRDPVLLDYLGLADTYSEQDLESAIVAEIQRFIIEMGSDFAFMARQKRMTIDGRDYYLDLLFYHRRLRCLVALELKLGEFEAAYKGQMELYLRWLEKYELIEGENLPIGLILCSGKSEEHIELMRLDESNIRVAEYLTTLPDLKLLEEKLKASIELARAQCQRVE